MHTQLSINPEKNVSIDLRVTNRNQKNKIKKDYRSILFLDMDVGVKLVTHHKENGYIKCGRSSFRSIIQQSE